MKSPALLTRVRLVLAFILALFFLIPVVWMLFVSVKTEGTPIKTLIDWFLPPYTFMNYANVLGKTPMLRWMGNSLFIALVKTVLTVLFTSLAAFAVSKIDFHYKIGFFFCFFCRRLDDSGRGDNHSAVCRCQRYGLAGQLPGHYFSGNCCSAWGRHSEKLFSTVCLKKS